MVLHTKNIEVAGVSLNEAKRALIMLHGRGGSPGDIISLAQYLNATDTHIIAPQAVNNSWYPYSFMAPVEQNQPWLKSALDLLEEIVIDVENEGLKSQQVFFLGFSQGACLTLEYVSRNARRYGGVIAFTGGLIGEVLDVKNYEGSFDDTKVFIGNSDHDPHVPLKRSEESKKIMEDLGAAVTLKVYNGMAHTINQDEIKWVNKNILK
jgi:phospholipase/carboxylesterase